MSKDVQDSIEQKRTLEKLEKRLGETMEMVDNAKNLKMVRGLPHTLYRFFDT